MEQQRSHQKVFLTYAFGGSGEYNGRYMREAHKEMVANQGLVGEHFDAMAQPLGTRIAEDLLATLEDMGVPEELRAEVAAVAAAPQHKKDVLNQ